MTRAAIDAARLGARRPAVVEVELIQEGSTLHLTVADSGDGVALDRDAVFVEGVSTRSLIDAPGGRGVGLALSRQIARARGGDIVIAHMGGQESDDNVRGGAASASQSVTRDLVFDAVRASDPPMSAGEIASSIGISRATAQRYLANLVTKGQLRMQLRYGSTGRPEQEYFTL